MFDLQISEKQQKDILRLSAMELWVKLQSGQLKAQDALKAYQAKVKHGLPCTACFFNV